MKTCSEDHIDNPVIHSTVVEIGAVGGGITSGGVSVNILPGSVRQSMRVSLDITRDQLPGAQAAGFVSSPHGIILTLDTTKFTTTPEIEIHLDREWEGDASTVIWVADPSNQIWPLFTYRSEDGARLVGRLTTPFFLRGEERRMVDGTDYALRIYTLTRRESPPPSLLNTRAMMFNRTRGAWGDIPAGFNPRGKRVALLVHGIIGSLQDFAVLTPQLVRLNGGGIPFYDVILGFEYTSTAPIARIGEAMIERMAPNIRSSASVDLIAYGMGGVVARWAMEQGDGALGPVTRYLSLGGPHAGLPFSSKYIHELLQLAERIYPGCGCCVRDLLTDGYQGEPSGFLASLNTKSPNPHGTRYYSIAGSDWHNYTWQGDGYAVPVGLITAQWYSDVCGARQAHQDGLVTTWSAQASVLEKKDPFWSPLPLLKSTHHGLVEDPNAIEHILSLIRQWQISGEMFAESGRRLIGVN